MSSQLLNESNAATRASGCGRIRYPDGTFEDIVAHNGGIVKTVLDRVQIICSDEEEEEEEPVSEGILGGGASILLGMSSLLCLQ